MTRRKALAEATVELTPLIDVVFLLLIFFMVSTSFIRQTQLDVELATASGEPRATDAGAVEIAVRRDGNYRVNGRPVVGDSPAALVAALVEATGDAPATEVRLVVAADARSTHQSVVRALEAAGDAGLTRIGLVTRRPEDTAPPTEPLSGAGTARQETGGEPDAG